MIHFASLYVAIKQRLWDTSRVNRRHRVDLIQMPPSEYTNI
jgi:hypothetical protein